MSYQLFNNGNAPATPASGKTSLYTDGNGMLHAINSDGVDMTLVPQPYNYVRNSGFWFAQRQNPAVLTTYSSTSGRAFTADGWAVSNENASAQYLRTDTSGFPQAGLTGRYFGNFTKITSDGKLAISQVIEASDANQLRGRSVRVQLWAKTLVAASATWRLALVQLTSSGTVNTIPASFVLSWNGASTDITVGLNLAYITPKSGVAADGGTVDGNAVDLPVTSAWTRFGAVFDVPIDCNNLVLLLFSDSAVVATNGIAISQASLTPGMQIVSWNPMAASLELERVQRYYAKSFSIDAAPVQNGGLTGAQRGAVSESGAAAGQPLGVRVPVPMWRSLASGTITTYNPSAANAFVRNTTTGSDATATASANQSDQSFDITFTGVGGGGAWGPGDALAAHYTADNEL